MKTICRDGSGHFVESISAFQNGFALTRNLNTFAHHERISVIRKQVHDSRQFFGLSLIVGVEEGGISAWTMESEQRPRNRDRPLLAASRSIRSRTYGLDMLRQLNRLRQVIRRPGQ